MSVTVVKGTTAPGTAGATATWPASTGGVWVAGDWGVVVSGTKPASASTIATFGSGGGTQHFESSNGAGQAANTGDTSVVMRWAVMAGTEGGTTVAVTDADDSVTWAQCYVLHSTVGWDTSHVAQAWGTDNTAGTSYSAACGNDAAASYQAGDFLIAASVIPTSLLPGTYWSAQAFAATGLTFSSVTEQAENTSGSGNNIGGQVTTALVASGSASGGPTVTFTATAGSATNNYGPTLILGFREVGPSTINGGQVTETDTALAGSTTVGSVIAGGLVTVAASVLAGSLLLGYNIAGGLVEETDTVQAGSILTGQTVSGGLVAETDTILAGSVVGAAVVAGGQAVESDTVLAGSVAQSVVGGTAVETDTVLGGTVLHVVTGGQAGETDTVATGTVDAGGDVIGGGQVTETDTVIGGSIVLHYYVTQTWNRAGGRVRGGYAELEWDPPVVTPAAGHNLPEGTVVVPDDADVPFAKMYGGITIDTDGNSVFVDPQTVFGPMLTVRLVINGHDRTFWRGARVPIPDWQYTEPFGYGPLTLLLEGIGPHEVLPDFEDDPDASPALANWLFPDARTKLQLVDHVTQTVHSTIWRGQLEDFIEADNDLQVIASGLWSGEASTRWLPQPVVSEPKDIGQLIWRLSESVTGVRFLPEGGPTTGLENDRLGEMKHIEAINLLLQRAQTRNKGPYTLTPTPWGTNKFRMVEKDTETIDATFYGEGKQVRLQRVRAGEADRIIGRGVTPGGQRVRNGRYPGVLDDPDEAIQAAPYPFEDDRTFGLDTTDGDTDTGDGISVMLIRLQTFGLLDREDVEPGVFNIAAEGAINRLRFRLGLMLSGLMSPNVWDALFNIGRIGSSFWWSKIEPMAQADWTIRWNTSADGSILSHHDGYDGDRRIVDKAIDFGVWRREQMFDFADRDLDVEQTPNIFGEVDFGDHGGLLRGSVDPGTVVTDEDFMHQLELRPGMNIRFPFTRWGDIVLRFPTFGISGGSSPRVLGRGSTRPVDSLPLWETLNEAKAARKNTDKLWWNQNRSSGKVSDAVGEFEEYGGQINPVTVTGDEYRVIKVLAGQMGMFEQYRLRTSPAREFVTAIFGLPIDPAKLKAVCPNPLEDKQGWVDSMNDLNADHRLLYLAGEPGDPGGYSPGSKSQGHALTGVLDDRSPFAFKTSEPKKLRPWVYVVFYAANDTTVHGGDQGRILWNQEIVGQ